uniref:PAS domain-containing protein n=2 Tax=Tetraodon nigroviridis TaxID=99883 RepID=H3DRC2_TETNG
RGLLHSFILRVCFFLLFPLASSSPPHLLLLQGNFISKRLLCILIYFNFFRLDVSSSPSLLAPDNTLERSFFIRMKSTLTKRGVHIKSSGYKVIHVTGRLRIRMALTHSRSVPNQIMGMVRIDCQMFVTRVNMDLKIVYCENRVSDYMDLTPVDVVGKRCYQVVHAEDVEGIRQSHLDCEYST